MNVGELRAELASYPDGLEVVMSQDGEGNGFSPLSQVADAMYVAERPWFGEVYAEEDAPVEAVAAVCLWPVN